MGKVLYKGPAGRPPQQMKRESALGIRHQELLSVTECEKSCPPGARGHDLCRPVGQQIKTRADKEKSREASFSPASRLPSTGVRT